MSRNPDSLNYLIVLCQLHRSYTIKWRMNVNDELERCGSKHCLSYSPIPAFDWSE
jgi:hypothetical protein